MDSSSSSSRFGRQKRRPCVENYGAERDRDRDRVKTWNGEDRTRTSCDSGMSRTPSQPPRSQARTAGFGGAARIDPATCFRGSRANFDSFLVLVRPWLRLCRDCGSGARGCVGALARGWWRADGRCRSSCDRDRTAAAVHPAGLWRLRPSEPERTDRAHVPDVGCQRHHRFADTQPTARVRWHQCAGVLGDVGGRGPPDRGDWQHQWVSWAIDRVVPTASDV